MKLKNIFYLPSGRIFLHETSDGYFIESTEMRDVNVTGKLHKAVRETENPKEIWKHLVPYSDKWLLTVSTQKGCAYSCKFCDVARLPFEGNLTQKEIEHQIYELLRNTPYVDNCAKAKIGFARMGEPALNIDNVLSAMKNLNQISFHLGRKIKWLPCFNTILPKQLDTIDRVINFKEYDCGGMLHFQISCNSTDEDQRKQLFGGASVHCLEDIISTVNKSKITKRTVTLNFIVMQGIEVSVKKLKKMGLNKDKFTVKLIPLNTTENAKNNKLKTFANYTNYDRLVNLGNEFKKNGIPVVIDAIAKCEEAGLCCGQLAQIYQ